MKKIYLFLALCLSAVFTAKAGTPVVYTEFNEFTGTLTYYYDDQMSSRSGVTEVYNPDVIRFASYNLKITEAVIDESMKEAALSSTQSMFYGGSWEYTLKKLTEIEGLKYLNTANVTSMRAMFRECEQLQYVDLTSFNTRNVADMREMFHSCKALKFIDIRYFKTDNLQNTAMMFYNCEALETILCYEDWSAISRLVDNSDSMFGKCTELKGGNGTEYNADYTNIVYARPDKEGKRGYFTSGLTLDNGWAYYDNGEYYDQAGYGITKNFYWGIRIPAGSVSGAYLTKVALFIAESGELTLHIYEGGETPANATHRYSQKIQLKDEYIDKYQEFVLYSSLAVDPAKDLWIVCENSGLLSDPASYSFINYKPDACWLDALNGDGWYTGHYEFAWMIRGYFSDTETPADEIPLHFESAPEASDITATSAVITWTGNGDKYEIRYRPKTSFDFSEGLDGWVSLDADGDGYGWYHRSDLSGVGVAASASWEDVSLTPDNYLVSPRMPLDGTFTFKACGAHESDFVEHFCVMVSTSDKPQEQLTAADFTQLSNEWIIQASQTWEEHSADLTAYSGQTGYVAIRHFNTTNQLRLYIKDIAISNMAANIPTNTITVSDISGSSYTLTGLESETLYEVQVRALRDGDEPSEWTAPLLFLTQSDNTGIEDIIGIGTEQNRKIFYDGQLYILRDGKTYNATGQEIK